MIPEIETSPTVPTTIERGDGYWKLTITCPYCGHKHFHGGGPLDEEPDLGHRLSHCWKGPKNEYELVADETQWSR